MCLLSGSCVHLSPLPNAPHGPPSGQDCAWGWAGLEAGGSQGSRRHSTGEGSLPIPLTPSQNHSPLYPWWGEVLLPITDQNPHHQIKVCPVTPICPILPAGAGQWALRTREELCVSHCPGLIISKFSIYFESQFLLKLALNKISLQACNFLSFLISFLANIVLKSYRAPENTSCYHPPSSTKYIRKSLL